MPDQPIGSSSQIVERKLATIISADVAGYSRLMGEDEEGTLKIFRGHKKIFESLVEMHHGRIFNTAGDAILAEFTSAVEAVRCATDIQAALRTRNDQLAPERQVKFRIGINLGDVLIQGQDLMGDGVNVAARIQTAAEPGGICISGSVHDQIVNKLSLSFLSLGEKNFKNIQQPVRTFSITDAEGHGPLPSPKRADAKSNALKWAAGVVAALLAIGAGYGAYRLSQRNATPPAPAAAPPAPAPAPVAAAPTAQTTAAPTVASTAAASSAPAAGAPKTKTREPAARAFNYDGAYSGQICYQAFRTEPLECHERAGSVHGDKITGEWVESVHHNVTMHLSGDIDPKGHVTILMHSQYPDGTGVSTINLTGTIHAKVLDASGQSRRGRPVTIFWQRHLPDAK
jgi:class 3 adenylate cyclase